MYGKQFVHGRQSAIKIGRSGKCEGAKAKVRGMNGGEQGCVTSPTPSAKGLGERCKLPVPPPDNFMRFKSSRMQYPGTIS